MLCLASYRKTSPDKVVLQKMVYWDSVLACSHGTLGSDLIRPPKQSRAGPVCYFSGRPPRRTWVLQDVALMALWAMLSLERNGHVLQVTVWLKWHLAGRCKSQLGRGWKAEAKPKSDLYSQWYSRKLGRIWPLISKIWVAKYFWFLWESQSSCVSEARSWFGRDISKGLLVSCFSQLWYVVWTYSPLEVLSFHFLLSSDLPGGFDAISGNLLLKTTTSIMMTLLALTWLWLWTPLRCLNSLLVPFETPSGMWDICIGWQIWQSVYRKTHFLLGWQLVGRKMNCTLYVHWLWYKLTDVVHVASLAAGCPDCKLHPTPFFPSAKSRKDPVCWQILPYFL